MIRCKLNIHAWTGCKCARCGKPRDAEHDWKACACSACGASREHNWQNCKCARCGKTRDAEHDWTADCNQCARCGKQRKAHTPSGCVCTTCGAACHDWEIRINWEARPAKSDTNTSEQRAPAQPLFGERCRTCKTTRTHVCQACGCPVCKGLSEGDDGFDEKLVLLRTKDPFSPIKICNCLRTSPFSKEELMTILKTTENASLKQIVDNAPQILIERYPGLSYFGEATLLHLAASQGDAESIAMLVGRGADLNARAAGGATPLHWTAMEGKHEAANALVGLGADLEARLTSGQFSGDTPLHQALRRYRVTGENKVPILLAKSGACPFASDPKHGGPNPLQLAREVGALDVISAFLRPKTMLTQSLLKIEVERQTSNQQCATSIVVTIDYVYVPLGHRRGAPSKTYTIPTATPRITNGLPEGVPILNGPDGWPLDVCVTCRLSTGEEDNVYFTIDQLNDGQSTCFVTRHGSSPLRAGEYFGVYVTPYS